jgi:hypothetical protein
LNDPTLFPADIPASLSVKQVTAKVKKIHATCGPGCATPLARLDPDTQSWKMFEDIFPLGEQPFLPILPPSGMTQNGTLLARKASAQTTVETESLSWPTPTAVTRPMEGNVRMYRAKIQAGEMTEAEAEAILGKSVWAAQGKVPEMWPTPRANSAMASTITPEIAHDPKRRPNLETVVGRRMWPTPITHGTMTATRVENERKFLQNGGEYSTRLLQAVALSNTASTGYLNPTWVEWLMGFPEGWTDLSA